MKDEIEKFLNKKPKKAAPTSHPWKKPFNNLGAENNKQIKALLKGTKYEKK